MKTPSLPRADRRPRRRARRAPRRGRPPISASATPRTSAAIVRLARWNAIAGRGLLMFGFTPISWTAGASALGLAKILENMEIGHNVMHGQYDWMNDPALDSQTCEWDNVCDPATVAALAQLRAPHVHQHPRQGPRRRLRRPARGRRRSSGARSTWSSRSPTSLLAVVVRVGRRAARPRRRATTSRTPEGRREIARPLAARSCARPRASSSRTTWSSRRSRSATRRACCSAISTANLARNVWSNVIIFCGHFPDGDAGLHRGGDDRTRRAASGTCARCWARPTSRAAAGSTS